MGKTLWYVCSVNDVEEKYYADGEDAYDMRKPFKDVKSKPAILPKGSGQQKLKQGTAKALQPPEPSTSQTSNSEQPAAEPQADKADSNSTDDVGESVAAASNAETKAAPGKPKASKAKKR